VQLFATEVLEIHGKKEAHLQICANCIKGFICDKCSTNVHVLQELALETRENHNFYDGN